MDLRFFFFSSALFIFTLSTPVAMAQDGPLDLRSQLEKAQSESDWITAIEISQRLLEKKPEDISMMTQLARFQVQAGDPKRATETIRTVEKLAGGESADSLEVRGDIAKASDQDDDALSLYQLAHRSAPKSVRVIEKIAIHHQSKGEADAAALYYQKLASLRENSRDHLPLARAAIGRRDWNAVIEHLTAIDEIDSRNVRGTSSGNYERLLEKSLHLTRLDRRIKREPQNTEPILERAALFQSYRFYPEALDDAKRAYRIDSRSPHVRISLAKAYADSGDRRKGAEFGVSIRGIGYFPHNSTNYRKLARYDYALNRNPQDSATRENRVELLTEHRQYVLAMEDIDRLMRDAPDRPFNLLLKETVLRAIGETREAKQLLRKLAQTHPDHQLVLERVGALQMADGLYHAAIETYDKILAANPNSSSARDARTLCYKRLNQQPPGAESDEGNSES